MSDTIDPPLRLAQRDDGQGPVNCHARLNVQADLPGQPSSAQLSTSPRLYCGEQYA